MLIADLAESLAQEIEAVLACVGGESSLSRQLRRWVVERERAVAAAKPLRWGMMPLLVCEAISGKWEKALPVAAATEFFITAGDALDDVEDRDINPSIWGTSSGRDLINGATALLMLGQQAILRLPQRGVDTSCMVSIMEAWLSAIFSACAGQQEDFQHESQLEVSQEDYLRKAEKKAAGLLSSACRSGAFVAAADQKVAEQYAFFGLNLGIAAQIANDVRDILSVPGHKSDISCRKKTLPVIYGLRQTEGEERTFLHSVYSGERAITPQAEKEVARILTRCGALHYSLVIADIYKQKAMQSLLHSGVSEEANRKLLSLLRG